MANTIKLKRGSGSDPTSSDLAVGELAIRTDEGKIFTKKDDGSVAEISGGGGAGTGQQFVNLETGNSASDTGVNTFAGYNAGNALTTADHTTLFGYQCGSSIQGPGNNSFFGSNAGNSTNSGDNAGFGGYAMPDNNGEGNTAVGCRSMKIATGSEKVTSVGAYSFEGLTTGDNNIAIGYEAGAPDGGTALTTGSNCILIGYQSAPSAADVSNEITLGNSSTTKFRIPGLNFSIKDSTATDNYVLTVDANGDAGWEAAPADSTKLPLAGGTITGNMAMTGNVFDFADSKQLRFGTGNDFEIFFNGTDQYLKSVAGKIRLQVNDGEDSIICNPNAGVELFYDDAKKAETVSGGFTVTGTLTTDQLVASGTSNSSITASGTNSNITLTSSGTNSNINLYSTGSNAQVKLEANNTDNSGFTHIDADTGVKLFHGGGFSNQKLATTSSGVTVTGTCTATTFSGSGASLTSLNGSNISSGTIAAARVATLNQDTTGNAATADHADVSDTVDIGGVTTNSDLQIVFSSNNAGAGRNLAVDSTDSKFTYNPSSNTLKVDNITAALSGTLDGYDTAVAATADTIVVRDDAGDINGRYFEGTWFKGRTTTDSALSSSNIDGGGGFVVAHESGWYYHQSASAVRSLLNVADGATNVTNNNQLTNGAGYLTSVSTSDLAADCITGAKIADSQVNEEHLVNNSVTAQKIAANSVGNSEMANAAIGIAELSATGTASSSTYLRGDNSWATISAGAEDGIFWENDQAVSSNYTITNGKNAMSAGPITINSGVTVTVGSGENWTIV